MTASHAAGEAAFLARYEGLADRLPGGRALRAEAAELFRAAGLPTPRDEAWKYTSLRGLRETPFHEALTEVPTRDAAQAENLLDAIDLPDTPRLVFADGRFRPDLSRLPSGITVGHFAAAPRYGTLARPDREPLVALNAMLAEDGAAIDLPPGHDAGRLALVTIGTDLSGTPVAFHPRHTIRLGAGARLTLIDIAHGRGAYLHNPVTEITLAEDATLAHIRIGEESAEAHHLATIYADIAARARYDGFSLVLGGRLVRTELHARLGGAGGHAALNAAQFLAGTQHADFTSYVDHDAPHCQSRQTVKNVLDNRARGVFQGKITVARYAQKTDGYQMNQALLLSPDAEIDSKPQLEIYADDVKCSHGATVGALDPDQLFYLQSRGVPQSEARGLLVRAFLAEAFDLVEDETARALLHAAIERRWTHAA